MLISHRKNLGNAQLRVYFSIFASAFAALFLMLLILQQLGTSDVLIRISAFTLPLLIFVAIGIGSYTNNYAEFFAAARCVPAVYSGLILAAAALGGSGLIIITGLLFINGFDAWCIPVGMISGFIIMGTMIAPFYRKHGGYTIPSYLGYRFGSRSIQISSAAIFAVPMVLLLTAELTMASYATSLLTGFSESYSTLILALVLFLCIGFGGMRSLSSVGSAQAIAAIIAIIVPTAIIGVIETNLPVAQLSSGPVLRSIGRMEVAQQIPMPDLSAFAFDLAGQGLTYLKNGIATPHFSLSPLSFALTTLTVMLGIACAPWLLPTSGATIGVHETRKSFSWTVFFIGIIVLTLSALAIFLRNYVMLDVVGRSSQNLPEWFITIASLGKAIVPYSGETIALSNIAFDRDGVLFAVPISANFPSIVFYLILAGVICASLAAAAVTLNALANMLSEDILLGLNWRLISTPTRLVSARIFCIITIGIGIIFASIVQTDPLQLLLWALSISAATAFPIVMLSIWWKKMNVMSALAGLISGFMTSILVILSGTYAPVPLPTEINGLFGIIPAFAATFFASKLGLKANSHIQDILLDIRIPGGETIYDREQRLLRLQHQQRSK